ncbi:MAG: Uma2 family endonuclease [Chthoniobacter sp.]|uniref:Uma2 family endonuclease n=1 Tax=Chthoniobacter sp. TaxID=2510640 RepID=UPI0032A976A9
MSVLHAPTYRWTVEEYEELGRAGILGENDRVELLNGEIIVMSPIGFRHATAVRLLTNFLARRSEGRFEVDPQNPFNLDDASQPQPDLTLLDPAVSKARRHPNPADLFLVIEVSDSTVAYDRRDKGPAYARNGVREYWLLNLANDVLEVFRDPATGGYRETLTFSANETIAPLAFPDLVLRVGDFLP